MSAFGPGCGTQCRKHKPGTANLSRRQRCPIRSGSDGEVAYNFPPRFVSCTTPEQHFLPRQPEEEELPPPRTRESGYLPLSQKDSSRNGFKAYSKPRISQLDLAFDANEHYFSDEEFSMENELDSLSNPYMDTGETAYDVPFSANRAKVPKILRFSPLHLENWKGWEAWLSIINKTKLNLTYCVMTSPGSSLNVRRRIGWILPDRSDKLQIRTDKPFSEFSNDFMAVFVAPVFFRNQLDQEKLELLWSAFGSKLFPTEHAEEHCINRIAAADDESLTDYSILDRISLTSVLSNHKKLDHVSSLHELSEKRFREVWDLNEDAFDLKLKFNLREMKRGVRRVRAKVELAADKSFALRAGVVVMTGIMLACSGYQWQYIDTPWTIGLFKGTTGALYGYVPPPEEPMGWTDFMYAMIESVTSYFYIPWW